MALVSLLKVLLLIQLSHLTVSLKWIQCVEPGEGVEANINCGQDGGQIHIIGLDAGRTAGGNAHPDAHCRKTLTDQTEDLRMACNTRTTCQRTVFYPRTNLCRWHRGIRYVMVTYECIPGDPGTQAIVLDRMAPTTAIETQELILLSAGYSGMTEAIGNWVCSIEVTPHTRAELTVYDFSSNSLDSSPYYILWGGEQQWAEPGARYQPLPEISTSTQLNFGGNSTEFSGRIWMKLTAHSEDSFLQPNAVMNVTCSEDTNTDGVGDSTAPEYSDTIPGNSLSTSEMTGTCLDTSEDIEPETTSSDDENPEIGATTLASIVEDDDDDDDNVESPTLVTTEHLSFPASTSSYPTTMRPAPKLGLVPGSISSYFSLGVILAIVLVAVGLVITILLVILLLKRRREKNLSPTSSTAKLDHLEGQLDRAPEQTLENTYVGISTIAKPHSKMKNDENDMRIAKELLIRSLPLLPGGVDTGKKKRGPAVENIVNHQLEADDEEMSKEFPVYDYIKE